MDASNCRNMSRESCGQIRNQLFWLIFTWKHLSYDIWMEFSLSCMFFYEHHRDFLLQTLCKMEMAMRKSTSMSIQKMKIWGFFSEEAYLFSQFYIHNLGHVDGNGTNKAKLHRDILSILNCIWQGREIKTYFVKLKVDFIRSISKGSTFYPTSIHV